MAEKSMPPALQVVADPRIAKISIYQIATDTGFSILDPG
jgi:hypothetical protein